MTTRPKGKLHVALTVDPVIPVPPTLYGGIERIVDFLARGLASRGHDVTLIAHPGSRSAGTLVPYGIPPHAGPRARIGELVQVGRALWSGRNEYDIVHSFGRLAGLLPILPYRDLPKIQSYQRDNPPWRSIRIATAIAQSSIRFTGCSTSLYANAASRTGQWATVFNGVDLSKYDFVQRVKPDAPLVFLGRIERIKGTHEAISIARAAGRRLIIAGNKVAGGSEPEYFDQEIAPFIDGDAIQYIGPVDDEQKNALLGSAAALLMPILWDEPFGIVMAEALACGTPVIGYNRGSVPEVVKDDATGFVCRNSREAVAAVARVATLDRGGARRDCEERFSDRAIVDAYESLYEEMITQTRRNP